MSPLLAHSGHGRSTRPRPPRCRYDMLTQPQEANLVTYNVGLCRMVNFNLDAPYEGGHTEVSYNYIVTDLAQKCRDAPNVALVHWWLASNQILKMIHFSIATRIPKVMCFRCVWIDAGPEPGKVCVRKDAGAAKNPLGSTVKLETMPAFFRFRFMRLM